MAGVVTAIGLVGLVFVIGAVSGVLILLGISTHRNEDGPGPRGGGRGPGGRVR